ncbi:MAG: TonB-dependent receptor plug domain-containing protein [Elusimicrobiota bacterium]
MAKRSRPTNRPPRQGLLRVLSSLFCFLAAAGASFGQQSPSDDFSFFQKEASVVTPSRQPSTPSLAPATVYVVTSDDIRESGAQTLWDALRTVPGVDVTSERTSGADVSIRGLNGPLNNRVLVLLDGKTVLNGFYDFTDWETIPVTLEEVDRIEIVEGPSSALYGGNAVLGVINIITKTPEQLKGGVVSYTGGERSTEMGTALVGDVKGAQAYKLDLGWRSTNEFSDARAQASGVGKAHGLWSVELPGDAKWSVSGGVAKHDVNLSDGPSFDHGETGFLRTDLKSGGTSARFFWNWGNTTLRDYPVITPTLDYNTYDFSVDQALDLPENNSLTVGTSWRRNTATSDLFAPGTRVQDLYAFFFEDTWRPAPRWSLVASGRADHHPLAGWTLSPRGSVVYETAPNQTVRVTASQAFRDPTLYEDYVSLFENIPVNQPPFTGVEVDIVSNPDLRPEQIQFVETAYRGNFESFNAGATGFVYRLTNDIRALPPTETLTPPVAVVTDAYGNGGETTAIGGELAGEFRISPELTSFANYSYECLFNELVQQTSARSAPRNKVNAGMKYKRRGWTFTVSGDWVDKTYWTDETSATNPVYGEVPSYLMLNVRAGYRFSGRWDGLELAASGFNIADRHYETLPPQSSGAFAQDGEIIASRWSGTIAYRWGR